MQNKLFIILLLSFTASVFGQLPGYWDKQRATTKEIKVGAGKRIILKSEELPIGTTEVVYRITLLDENQQMANSLVSVLKAIPDPTGISQGSAGAVLLLSKISGDDKCKYAIFTDKEFAQDYTKTGETSKACVFRDSPINKDAKRLSLGGSTCFKSGVMWFGFESSNWIMNQRIVLEVVPWVDYKAARGWTLENRKMVIEICKTTDLAKKIPDANSYCVCVLQKIQSRYRYVEFLNLLASEKTKAYRDAGKDCYIETDALVSINDNRRKEAAQLASQGKFSVAIAKLLPIIEEGTAKTSDYNALAVNYIFTRQYDKAIKTLKDGEKLDPSELLTQLNLAHAYLFRNNYAQAKTIYKKYRSQNVSDFLSWNEKIKLDFGAFENAGLPSKDFKRILNAVE